MGIFARAGADIVNSTLRGNEGDDQITVLGDADANGAILEGNAGEDVINASSLSGDATLRGGKDDDRLIGGNGQTMFGGKGADTFVVANSGGVFIADYDKLDLDGDVDVDDPDCFCDDRIEVENIAFNTHTYDVERVKNTAESNWTGDIKVKAVAEGNANDLARVTLQATKTATITAKAVARLFITETKTSLAMASGNLQAYQEGIEAG